MELRHNRLLLRGSLNKIKRFSVKEWRPRIQDLASFRVTRKTDFRQSGCSLMPKKWEQSIPLVERSDTHHENHEKAMGSACAEPILSGYKTQSTRVMEHDLKARVMS